MSSTLRYNSCMFHSFYSNGTNSATINGSVNFEANSALWGSRYTCAYAIKTAHIHSWKSTTGFCMYSNDYRSDKNGIRSCYRFEFSNCRSIQSFSVVCLALLANVVHLYK